MRALETQRPIDKLQRQPGHGQERGDSLTERIVLRLRRAWRRRPLPANIRYTAMGDDYETFCRKCGLRTSGRRVTYQSGRDSALKRLVARLSQVLRNRRPAFEDAKGRIAVSILLGGVDFPVYGLKGGPLGFALHGLGWGGERRRASSVTFKYVGRERSGPTRAIELYQGPGTIRTSSEGRLSSELHAIVSVVSSQGSEALRREYLHRGNLHRDWNLERIKHTPRRRLIVRANRKAGGSARRW